MNKLKVKEELIQRYWAFLCETCGKQVWPSQKTYFVVSNVEIFYKNHRDKWFWRCCSMKCVDWVTLREM